MRRSSFLLLLLALFAIGCPSTSTPGTSGVPSGTGGAPATGGTETGNTTTGLALRVVGYQSSLMAAPAAITVGDLSVTTAKIVLDRIRFRPFSACQDGAADEGAGDVEFNGPFTVDLLNPAPLNGLEDINIPSGRYCRIELVLKTIEDSADPMLGKSVFIQGERSDHVPFEMSTDFDDEFELENETTGFVIDTASSALQIFFIGFDLDRWFAGVNFSDPSVVISTDTHGNPIIYVNSDFNESLREAIEENIKFSSDLFKDSDNNEHLDSGEQEHPLAEGTSLP